MGYAGGTKTGFERAEQLATQTSISDETVRVMHAWFARHGPTAKNGGTSYPGYRRFVKAVKNKDPSVFTKGKWRGAVSWLLWGGTPAYEWIRKEPIEGGAKLCKRGLDAAKARFKVFPSAYANAHASMVCRGKIKGLDGKRRADPKYAKAPPGSGLARWFKEKWVDVCSGEPCGRRKGEARKQYPYCRPTKRISSKTPVTRSEMSKSEIREMCRLKKRLEK